MRFKDKTETPLNQGWSIILQQDAKVCPSLTTVCTVRLTLNNVFWTFYKAYKIAVTVDVEKFFLIISTPEEDQDALRFLWVDNINKYTTEV